MSGKKKILLTLGGIVLLIAIFFPKDATTCRCLGKNLEASFFAGGGISQCFGIPYSCTPYEKGMVIVSFNEGTKYKDAIDLLSGLEVQIEETPPLWRWGNFQPTDDTELRTVNMFKLRVKEGKEEKVISQLLKSPIVRAATKNYYGKLID